MNSAQFDSRLRRHAGGYSLAEVMVAMAILTIVILAALTIYDRSNRVFNQGVQASDMQQSTRVAFDKLVSDVRLAGFDFDRDGIPFGALAPTWTSATAYVQGNLIQPSPPNGHTYVCTAGGTSGASQPATWPTASHAPVTDNTVTWQEQGIVQYQQPDEQLEYVGESAITIRANFDYSTETGPCAASGAPVPCENGREQALESTQFPVVTTDNDEIATYALVSNSTDSKANKNSVVFFADIDRPRDINPSTKKKEPQVTISGVDTTNLYPPYTLYRYTLNNSGAPVGTPIADNIRSLKFHYYTDTAGTTELTPLPYGNGQFDAGAMDTVIPERDARATIKSIRVELVGMNPNIDGAYTDGDTVAPHYRKYELDSLVVPRNIGKHGMKEFNTLPPSAPAIQTVCASSCNAVYVTWQGPSSGGDVESYNILYDVGNCGGAATCNGCNIAYSIAEDAGSNLAGYATKITPGQTYRFSVQSLNKYGSATATNCISVNVLNTVKPGTPTALDASGSSTNAYPAIATGIQLYWPPVAVHDSSNNTTSCSDGTTKTEAAVSQGENIRYRVWRSKNNNFQIGDSGVTEVLSETTATQPTVAGTNLTWLDNTLPMGSCITYYYRMQAVIVPCCSNDSQNSGGNKALAKSGYFPAQSGPGANGRANTAAKPAAPTGVGLSTLNCSGNTCDVKVTWSKVTADTGGSTMFVDGYVANLYQKIGGVWTGPIDTKTTSNGGSSATFDNLDSTGATEYKVTVKAVDCLTSDESQPAYYPCDWTAGTITVTAPGNYGGDGSSGSPWIIQYPSNIIVATVSAIQSVSLAVFNGQTQIGPTQTNNVAASSFTFTLPQTPDSAKCKVHITMTALAPSTCVINQDYYVLDEPPPPCALTDAATDPSIFAWSNTQTYVNVTLKNTSADVLKLQKIFITWNTSYNSGHIKTLVDVIADVNGASPKTFASGCATSKVIADFTSSNPDTIPANSTSYVVKVDFSFNGNFKLLSGTQPIQAICVQYQTPFGDIKTCSIAPNAGNCTIPGGAACQ